MQYVVMYNRNLRMRICFKFQVQDRQNASIETWIRAAKFSLKVTICSEDMDKMQTKFPPSGMHSGGDILKIPQKQ